MPTLDELMVFITVAEEAGFRAAGRQLGVSGSAVSQAIGRLEKRLGVALVERTTRTVRLTDAGEHYYAVVAPALRDVRAAEEAVREEGATPRGTLRLRVSRAAESFLNGPFIAGFLEAFPEIRLDLDVVEHTGEIVAEGYDAGIGLGEMIARDMVAMPISEEQRMLVVGTPGYFADHPPPVHPRDLADHVCINWRPGSDEPPYQWEFTEDGADFTVDVDARIVTTDAALNNRLAQAGTGLTITFASYVREQIDAGQLVTVLEEYSEPFPGFYLYYPRRRHRRAALQALIDFAREHARVDPRRQ